MTEDKNKDIKDQLHDIVENVEEEMAQEAEMLTDESRQNFDENNGNDEGDDGTDSDSSGKKGKFGKCKKQHCDHDPDTLDALARERADFQNYKKRAEETQQRMRNYGKRDTVMKLIPVIEEIARARQAEEIDANSPFGKIATKLDDTFKGLGVTTFGAVGEEFDHNLHQALQNRPAKDEETIADNKVLIDQVVESGYKLDDEVIKPAMVITVSKG